MQTVVSIVRMHVQTVLQDITLAGVLKLCLWILDDIGSY